MAKQTFTTGQVLTASEMTSLQQTAMGGGSTTAKVASYVLVAADAGTVVQMNAAGATTITVNTALFAAGDSVQIQNIGAGVCTVTAGTATVSTAGSLALSQYEGGQLYFNSTSAALFFDIVQSSGMSNPMTTTGDIIYSSSGSTPARLGIGTTGQVLNVTSGLPAWATASTGALTLISTTNFTSQSSQAFNSVFSATYRNYKIIMSVLGSSDPYTLNFYYRASGTNNTSANYNWGQSNSTRGGTLAIGSYGSDVANMPLGPSSAPTGSTVYFNVDATVFQPFGLGKRQTIHLSYSNSTNGGQGWSAIQGYESTAYDGFAITPSAGTITGTVSIYGMSN